MYLSLTGNGLSLDGFDQGSARSEAGFWEDLSDLLVGRWTMKGGVKIQLLRGHKNAVEKQ